jgi:RES domain-containing protein
VVYLSREPETAMHEANEHRRYYRLPVWQAMPKVTVAVRVEANSILDLTNPAISAGLPEPMRNLLAEDWRAIMDRGEEPTTQAMGRAAFKAGLKGLMVASKPDPNGANLIVFPDVLAGKDVLEVLNPQALKKLGTRA